MAITAQTALTEAKALLNDPSGTIYPDAAMLPLLQKAYAELQTKMMRSGLPVLKEQTSAQVVNAGTVALGDGAGLPADLVYPIELGERAVGSSASIAFEDMTEMAWEPSTPQDTKLIYWNWRDEEIKFLGSTVAREVRIRYMKGLTRITAVNTPVTILNSTTFLAARCAAIAALVLGSNPSRAEALQGDAGDALDDLLGVLVKRQQGIGIRRRVNRYRR
jgi:hypothetical protein